MNRFLKTAISLLLAVSALSCTKEGVKTLELVDPAIVDGQLYLRVGESHMVLLDIFPLENGEFLKWSSSDESVAVADAGYVAAVSAGEATITAKSVNGKKIRFKVIVGKILIESWSAPGVIYVAPGFKSSLGVKVNMPEDASAANLAAVITDDPSGYLSAAFEKGEWWVSCSDSAPADGSYEATLKLFNDDGSNSSVTTVVVKFIPLTSLSFTFAGQTVMVSRSLTLSVTVNPGNATYGDYIEWTADDPCVSIVPMGRSCSVRGNSVGKANVVASTPDGKSATCVVMVTEPVVSSITANFDKTSVLCLGGAEDDPRTLNAIVYPSDLFTPEYQNLTPDIWDLDVNVVRNLKKTGWGMVKVSAGNLSVVRKILVVDKNINPFFCKPGDKDEDGDYYKSVPVGVAHKALPGLLMQMYYGYNEKQLDYDDFLSLNKQYGIEFPVSTVTGWTQPSEGKSFYLYALPPASLGSTASASGKYNGKTLNCSLSTAITSVSMYGNSGAYSSIEKSLLLPKGVATNVRRSDIAGKNMFFVLNPDSMYDVNSSLDTSRIPEIFTLCCDKTAGVTIQKSEYLQYLRFDSGVALGDYTIWFKEYPEATFTLRLY